MKINKIKAFAGSKGKKGNLTIDYLSEEFDYYKDNKEIRIFGGNKLKVLMNLDKYTEFETIKKITQNRYIDKNNKEQIISKNVNVKSNTAFEFQLDVPKSFSFLYVNAKDENREVIEKLFSKLEREFFKNEVVPLLKTRIKKNNVVTEHKVSADEVLHFSVQHLTNRENEPQLHRHNVFIAQFIDENNKFRTIETEDVAKNIRELQLKWQCYLAKALVNELNVDIETKQKANSKMFEIKTDKDLTQLIKDYSSRQKQIEEYHAKQKQINENYDEKDLKNIEKARVSTRKQKEKSESLNLIAMNKLRESKIFSFKLFKSDLKVEEFEQRDLDSYSKTIVDRLTEKSLTVDRIKFIGELIADSNFKIDFKQAEITFKNAINKELVEIKTSENKSIFLSKRAVKEEIETTTKLAKYLNTNSNLKISEHQIIKSIKKFEKKKGFQLLEEQAEYLFTALSEKNGAVINGVPGAGKTTVAEALKAVYEASGGNVVGLAPTGKASSGLGQEVGIDAATIQSFIKSKSNKINNTVITDNTLIIIDEAGMISSNDYKLLMNKLEALKVKPKIVLVGDYKQLASVERGQLFKSLVKNKDEYKIKFSELKNINRQKNKENKEAVNLLIDMKHYEAYKKFDDLKMIETFKTKKDYYNYVSKQYLQSRENEFEKVILDYKKEDVKNINQIIRNELKANNHLSKEFEVKLFQEDEEVKVKLAINEKIKFCKNDKSKDIQNGLQAVITDIKKVKDDYEITCKDNKDKVRTFKLSEYNEIVYGYAMTIHSSQGITVNQSISRISNIMNSNLVLVSNSRNRHSENSKICIIEEDFKFKDTENKLIEAKQDEARKTNSREKWQSYDDLKKDILLKKVAKITSRDNDLNIQQAYSQIKQQNIITIKSKTQLILNTIRKQVKEIDNKQKEIIQTANKVFDTLKTSLKSNVLEPSLDIVNIIKYGETEEQKKVKRLKDEEQLQNEQRIKAENEVKEKLFLDELYKAQNTEYNLTKQESLRNCNLISIYQILYNESLTISSCYAEAEAFNQVKSRIEKVENKEIKLSKYHLTDLAIVNNVEVKATDLIKDYIVNNYDKYLELKNEAINYHNEKNTDKKDDLLNNLRYSNSGNDRAIAMLLSKQELFKNITQNIEKEAVKIRKVEKEKELEIQKLKELEKSKSKTKQRTLSM